ncbi:MAG: CPBP family intramembrane metalloprotease [Chloroflexi bacterium]|nr:CPBP family intramembrane metalloprotease [Chloroflexota bacterium]
MTDKKWIAPILPYLAVWAGLFLFKSAWLSLLGFHAAILLVLAIARPNIPIKILFQSRSIKWIFANLLLCGLSGMGLYFLWDKFGIASDLPERLESIGLTSSSWAGFIAYFSLVNPFIEEYFWRAYLGSDRRGFHIGDLIYAGYHGLIMINKMHILSILFALTCLTFIGWFWRQSRREDEGLLTAVLGHMAADFSILVCVVLKVGAG